MRVPIAWLMAAYLHKHHSQSSCLLTGLVNFALTQNHWPEDIPHPHPMKVPKLLQYQFYTLVNLLSIWYPTSFPVPNISTNYVSMQKKMFVFSFVAPCKGLSFLQFKCSRQEHANFNPFPEYLFFYRCRTFSFSFSSTEPSIEQCSSWEWVRLSWILPTRRRSFYMRLSMTWNQSSGR